jgi:hypothetical protein
VFGPEDGTMIRRPTRPSVHETEILRRIARGFLLCTQHSDAAPSFAYEDGTPVDAGLAKKLIKRGWLIGDSDALPGTDGGAQRYDARRVQGGRR